jgi:hypothetical protein
MVSFNGARRSVEQGAAESLLQPLDLKTDRRLRSTKPFSGASEAASVGDRHEAAKEIDIKIAQHGVVLLDPFRLSMMAISITRFPNAGLRHTAGQQENNHDPIDLVLVCTR